MIPDVLGERHVNDEEGTQRFVYTYEYVKR